MRLHSSRCVAVYVAFALVAGCGGSAGVPQSMRSNPAAAFQSHASRAALLPRNVLIAADYSSGDLEYWSIGAHGGSPAQPLTHGLGLDQPQSMAANGHRLVIADDTRIDVFDVDTMQQTLLPDPYGYVVDVALGKDGSIYGLNFIHNSMNVVAYPPGSMQPSELTCSVMQAGDYIAVNVEGDVFISGTDNSGAIHLAKIAKGSTQCKSLDLRAQEGYPGGLAIDPKTDDLLVMDNPGVCAGPPEGRLVIYRKPYRAQTGIVRVLGGVCPSELRLDARSTTVFYGDDSLDEGMVVRQASYPEGKETGAYSNGGTPLGFTTIPNTLPN